MSTPRTILGRRRYTGRVLPTTKTSWHYCSATKRRSMQRLTKGEHLCSGRLKGSSICGGIANCQQGGCQCERQRRVDPVAVCCISGPCRCGHTAADRQSRPKHKKQRRQDTSALRGG